MKSKSKGTHPTGFVAIRSVADIQKALARRINRILMDQGEDHHGGQLAALCNAWVNAAKFGLESIEAQQVREELAELRRQVEARDNNGPIIELENR